MPRIIWDLYRLLKYPKHHLSIWRDYLQTRSDVGFMRRVKEKTSNNKKIAIVVSMTEFVFQLKLESLLALALKMDGWHVIVLTNNAQNIWARRFFEAFGLTEFYDWDEIKITDLQKERCTQYFERLLADIDLDFKKVKSWSYQESWVGPQILSSVARETHKGAPDIKDPGVLARMRELLPQTLERVEKAKLLIEKLRPDFMFGIEANYALMGPIVDQAIAAGVSFAQVVQPSRDDALIIRRLNTNNRRMHPNTLTTDSFEWISKNIQWTEERENELMEEFDNRYGGKWFLQSRNQVNTIEKSIIEIQNQLDLDPYKKTAAIFSHVLWDANLFYGEDIFLDYEDWFVQTLKAACNNSNINWIVKLHPANLWKRARDSVEGELAEEALIREHIGILPGHVKLLMPDTDISTRSLFALIDYGLTVRGTVGMELPCFGKLTFTAGTGRYSGFSFTNDSHTVEEYLQKISKMHTFKPMESEKIIIAKKFAYGVFKFRPFVLKSCRCTFRYEKLGHHPLDHNLSIIAKTLAEVENNGDLLKFSAWVNDPKLIDYMDIKSDDSMPIMG